jgi:hypothetical protein
MPCSHNARLGFQTCGKHKMIEEVIHLQLCIANKANGQRCNRHANHQVDDEWLCGTHAAAAARWHENEQFMDMWDVILLELQAGSDPRALERAMIMNHTAGLITYNVFTRIIANLMIHDRYGHPVIPAAPAGPTSLAEIATDAQSVHTTVVSEQTNRGLEVLLAVEVDDRLYAVFEASMSSKKDLMKDFKRWYGESSCCKINDWLYKRTFDGLLSMIFRHKDRTELVKRLQEEMKESIGMCCVGHINRLVNVMVGFDDRFAPPVPAGEILQQRIARIAEMDISVEEKVGEAWTVFDELKIPMAERDAWVEAF